MKQTGLFALLLLFIGCLSGEPVSKGIVDEEKIELNISQIAIVREDLEHGWTPSFENLSKEVYEKRFIRVEDQFGELSRIKNIVHQYPDSEAARRDFQNASSQLKSFTTARELDVGENSIMWIQGSEAYILFIRKNILIEIKYTGSGLVDEELILDLAKKVDKRI